MPSGEPKINPDEALQPCIAHSGKVDVREPVAVPTEPVAVAREPAAREPVAREPVAREPAAREPAPVRRRGSVFGVLGLVFALEFATGAISGQGWLTQNPAFTC